MKSSEQKQIRHPLGSPLCHFHRDRLIRFAALAGALQQRLDRGYVPCSFHEAFYFVSRADVVGWPHFPDLELFGL
ncbi:MAG TPA: hypothetical protein VNV15_06280 [Opitutaceae bacterium]|nr:hypothetical protein [Opitutaceae bacterium]